MRASVAAHTSWARTSDPRERTAPARAAFLRRFEDQVDPDRVLDPADRTSRAESMRKAHFQRLALRSATARRNAGELLATAEAAESELSTHHDSAT